MEDHDHREPIILTSPGRLARGIIIVGITLAVGAAFVFMFFDEMIANPPPVALIKHPTPTPTPTPPVAGTTTIAILAGSSAQGSPDYDPDDAKVPLGNKIVWRNDDTTFHTATSGTGSADPNVKALFDTGLLEGGKSSAPVELKNAKVGDVIDYHCTVHPYMTAKITITAAGPPGEGPGPAAGPTLNILAGSSAQGAPDFEPDQMTIKKGDKVNVVNQDNTFHSVTNGVDSADPNSAKLFDTKLMEAGKSVTLDTSALEPSSYPFYCMVHPYMKGTLVVE